MANSEKQAFFERYAPLAMEHQQRYGIPASVTLAQMYIESGGGTSKLAVEGNNYFGIKCSKDWLAAGKPYSLHNDDKPNEKFCNYASVEESVQHHSQFLMGSRYARCRQNAADDYRAWAAGLQRAGYATDPNYSAKLVREIETFGLHRYDRMALQGNYVAAAKTVSGGYFMPVDGGDIKVTSLFGHRSAPTAGASTNHNGIDIAVPRGTPVRASETGRIVDVKNNLTEHDSNAVRQQSGNKGGNFVIVEYPRADGSSYRVSYCHLTENGIPSTVRVGETVAAGSVIGYSGSTGNGTGPHLHLTVRKVSGNSSSYVNPLDYLAEVSVRGGLTAKVEKGGQDLLASRRTGVDTTPTPNDVLLAEQAGQLNEQQRKNAETAFGDGNALGQGLTASGPNSWLKYLMDDEGMFQDGDIITALLHMMFVSAISMSAMFGDGKGQEEKDAAAVQVRPETEEQKAATFIKRQRETVDADNARQLASMNFDAESPEQRGQAFGQRFS